MSWQSVRALTRRAVILGALGGVVVAVGRVGHGTPVGRPSPLSGRLEAGGSRSGTRPAGNPPIGADRPVPGAGVPVPVPPELPRGGRRLFPRYRLIGYSGSPESAAFGRLGIGNVDARAAEIERLAVRYADGRVGQPVFELIVVVAQRFPGGDGLYRVRADPTMIASYLTIARRHRALLLLNVQPGRARFIDEVRALERWLLEPDIGVALDPEWAVRSGQVPGRVFGRTSGAELDEVARYLSGLVAAADLPDKAMVVHQLAARVISDLPALREHPGVAVIKSVDGIGTPAQKVDTWRALMRGLPPDVHPGFKLFFEEDTRGTSPLMTPAQVLALVPTPEYVLYE